MHSFWTWRAIHKLNPFFTGPTLPAMKAAMVARDTDETQPLEAEVFGDIGAFDLAMPIDEEQEEEPGMDDAINTANAEIAEPQLKVLSCEQNMVKVHWDHLTSTWVIDHTTSYAHQIV